jgi:hypothetical protein
MNRNLAPRVAIATLLLVLPLFAGCPDPVPSGPGGGPSSGTTGSTNAPGSVGPSGPSGPNDPAGH